MPKKKPANLLRKGCLLFLTLICYIPETLLLFLIKPWPTILSPFQFFSYICGIFLFAQVKHGTQDVEFYLPFDHYVILAFTGDHMTHQYRSPLHHHTIKISNDEHTRITGACVLHTRILAVSISRTQSKNLIFPPCASNPLSPKN